MLPRLEVWRVDLVAAGGALAMIEARTGLLSADDRARALALKNSQAAAERLAVVIALRLVVESTVGPRWRAVPLERGNNGKPMLPGDPIHFSLSHVQGLALIALADRPVGIDLERYRAVAINAARRRSIEAAAVLLAPDRPLPPAGGEQRFLQAWTRLEALAKADGRGIGWLLGEIGAFGPGRGNTSIDALPKSVARVTADHGVTDLELGDAHYGAVAGVTDLARPVLVRELPHEVALLDALRSARRCVAP